MSNTSDGHDRHRPDSLTDGLTDGGMDRGQNPDQGPGGKEAEAPSHRQAEADREAFGVRLPRRGDPALRSLKGQPITIRVTVPGTPVGCLSRISRRCS